MKRVKWVYTERKNVEEYTQKRVHVERDTSIVRKRILMEGYTNGDGYMQRQFIL